MSNTAALLGNLLNTNADINYYTQQSIYWNAKYEANSAKLEKQVNYEQKWESAFDAAIDNTKEIAKKLSNDYECIKVTSWKECKNIIDNIDEI